MPIEITSERFRPTLEDWLSRRRQRVWLATPFLSFRVAQWCATLPAGASGDRRLLVAWDARSLDDLYLSAAGVETLRTAGFEVRDLRRLHAKVVVAGTNAYMGSGNLTAYGLDGGNAELGAFATGRSTPPIASAFERWWAASDLLQPSRISAAIKRQARIASVQRDSLIDETQPGHRPAVQWTTDIPKLDPDAHPAVAPNPPAVVHYWRGDTIALNLGQEGKPMNRVYSGAAMAGKLPPGSKLYTVGWAPMGGLLLLNRITVERVARRNEEWHLSGRGTPLRFDRAITGDRYAKTVRIRGQRNAPDHYMSFTPMAYIAGKTAAVFDRIIDGTR